jgi:uncharacterized protein YndB with AHSA1/START domain
LQGWHQFSTGNKNNIMKSNISSQLKTTIKAPAFKVWEALTTPSVIKKYLFGTDTITDWEKGGPIVFKGEWQGKSYEDKGTILEIKNNKLIKYSYWSSMSGIEDKPENYMIVTYEISGEDNNVTLSLTQENIPDEKTKTHSAENWKKVLENLKQVVEKEKLEQD